MNGLERDDIAFSLEERRDECPIGLRRELGLEIDGRELAQLIHGVAKVRSGAAIDKGELEVLHPAYIDLMPRLLDDTTQLRGGGLCAFALRDVDERHDDTVYDVLDTSIRPDMQDESTLSAFPKIHFALDVGEGSQHALYVGLQMLIVEDANELSDRASTIGIAEVQKLRYRRRKRLDAQLAVEEQGRNFGAIEEIAQVAVGARQIVVLVAEL